MKPLVLNNNRQSGGRAKAGLALLLLLSAGFAGAQSNDIPGDTDYARFSGFITQRNIFDPDRYPHETHVYHRTVYHRSASNSAPSFALVGTMSYGKGTFAFFSGNNDDLKKILPVSGTIAGYRVTEITMAGATLQGTDKKNLQLNIGDQLRQENNGWQMEGPADAGADASSSWGGGSGSPATGEAAGTASEAPSASLGNNDVLKRLMELREQENK